MRPKTLTNHELIDIKDIYLRHTRGKIKIESAQIWYEVCLEFLSRKYKGSIIIPESVRQGEDRVLQDDMFCAEYISALMKVVTSDLVQLTENQKVVLLITATADERQEALALIQS